MERRPQLVPITGDVLGALEDEAELLGLRPMQMIHLTRMWLLVEGEHDAMIVRHYYGAALKRARARLFILRGAKNAFAEGQLEHLASYQAPIRGIFDDPIASGLLDPDALRPRTTLEKKAIAAMTHTLESAEADFQVHEIPFPDVFCVLPDDVVAQTLRADFHGRSTAWPGWDAILTSYDAAVEAAIKAGKDKPDFEILPQSDRAHLRSNRSSKAHLAEGR